MTEQWENDKGVKFVGQGAGVPAADFKAATVIDYKELKTVEIELGATSAPSEGANGDIQTIDISAHVKSAVEDPLTRWNYDIQFSVKSDIITNMELANTVSSPHSGSTQVIFPAGVVAGQTSVVKAISGGVSGKLTITVI